MSSSRELTLIEHLGELRRRVFICLTALIVGAVVAFYFWTELLELLKWPAQDLINRGVVTPIVTQVTERLSTAVKISMVGGFVLALPVILYQVVRFVAPGLMPGERRYLFLFMPGALLAFFCGLAFAYFVLTPRAIPFLLTFGGDVAQTQIRISNLVDVMLRLLLWMGLAFETPVLMYLLAQLGIVSSRMFSRFRKYWVVIAFILGAIITPTFDPLNQTLVAAPLLALYEIGIFLAWLAGRARQREGNEIASLPEGQ
ncbi:Sec-independent protein translocase protein TatC [Geodia barretti]|uniref:Sec-independent protein translocase protein TatC n=2 Tax=Geodia barretti TaxID=519541 RepID=A0AA35VZV6_GEOBA|nr:Sec-independent protein translocase protein TatC [Geodia barretti]